MKKIRMYFLLSLYIGLSTMVWGQPYNCDNNMQIVDLRGNLKDKFLLPFIPNPNGNNMEEELDCADIQESIIIFSDINNIAENIGALGNIELCNTSSSSWRRYLSRLQELAEAIACINSSVCNSNNSDCITNLDEQEIIDALNNGLEFWYNDPCPLGNPNLSLR